MLKHGARSESEGHAIERRKPSRGSLCLGITRGHAAAPYWSSASSPAGVGLEHVQTDNRGSPGTWEILSSPRLFPVGVPGYQLQASTVHSSVEERTNECNRGTAKRRKRSAAGRATGSRSVLIVPMKLGNSPWRTQWRKAKRRLTDSVEGNMSSTLRFDQHVTVT
jgi:hypothetical protein